MENNEIIEQISIYDTQLKDTDPELVEILDNFIVNDLKEEYDRIKEKNRKHKELKQLLKEKGYASKSPEIINLLEEKKDEGKQELYRETLHCFGKKAGGEIYQIIKDF